jgi:hypothetical protein
MKIACFVFGGKGELVNKICKEIAQKSYFASKSASNIA